MLNGRFCIMKAMRPRFSKQKRNLKMLDFLGEFLQMKIIQK